MDNIITNADGVKVKVRVYDFGKRVKDIDSLPKKVIEFIKYITQ